MTRIIPTPEVLEKEERAKAMIGAHSTLPSELAHPPVDRDIEVQVIPFRVVAGIKSQLKIGTARVITFITFGAQTTQDRSIQFGASGQPFPVLDSVLQVKVPWGVDQIELRSPTLDWIGQIVMSPDPRFEYDSQALTWPPLAPGSTPGELIIIGGNISKFWSPTVLGLNNVHTFTSTGTEWLVTPFLDLRGTTRYVVYIRRVNGVGDAVALTSCTWWAQYRLSNADPTPSPTPVLQETNAIVSMTSTALVFPGNAAPFVQNGVLTQSSEAATGSSANARPLAIGPDARFLIQFGGAHMPSQANDFFTVAIWGQT